jgi:hypothetical protein
MTDTSSSPEVGARIPAQSLRARREPTAWVGWIVFAAVMMIMVGVLHAIEGFVALFKDSYYLVRSNGLVVSIDYTAWGWVHLIAGLLVAGAGAALFTGRMWARVVGVVVAVLSLLANFAFIQAYPLWSTILIAVDVFIIYALTVHGREIKDF